MDEEEEHRLKLLPFSLSVWTLVLASGHSKSEPSFYLATSWAVFTKEQKVAAVHSLTTAMNLAWPSASTELTAGDDDDDV